MDFKKFNHQFLTTGNFFKILVETLHVELILKISFRSSLFEKSITQFSKSEISTNIRQKLRNRKWLNILPCSRIVNQIRLDTHVQKVTHKRNM